MLQELESFNGVVIFTTNLAANFDPAFERRIRTHVMFEMPGVDEREQIWKVQVHPTLTPLADDVDFRALAEGYAVSGGDIRNAVLKAALAAASEPASDAFKVIHHRHLEAGIRDVVAGRQVMRQSLFAADGSLTAAAAAVAEANGTPVATDPLELMLARLSALQKVALIAAIAGGASLIVAIVALIVALLR